jgi:hypothetical protein
VVLLSPILCQRCLAQANIKHQVAEIDLAKLKPIVPLDREVHVGLFVPPDLKAQNPVAYYVLIGMRNPPLSWSLLSGDYTTIKNISLPQGADVPDVKVIDVDLATAYATRIRDLVHGLFTSTTLYRSPQPNAAVDVLLSAEMHSRWTEYSDHRLRGLEVRLTLSAVDSAGEKLGVMEGVGYAEPTKEYWSTRARCAGIGAAALSQAFNDLEQKIRGSEVLNARLHRLAEARALPAQLDVTAEFDDHAGLLPNGRLDAGEQASLIVRVGNRGVGSAYSVAVRAAADRPEVTVSGGGVIGDMTPGEQHQVVLPVTAGLGLREGALGVRIEACDKRGYCGRPVLLRLTAAALAPPRLQIVDVALNDGTGRAEGDGDGRPANGETVEAIVRVRNEGPGDAVGVAVTAASRAAGLEILEPRVLVPRVGARQLQEARVLFRLPVSFAATQVSLDFTATDVRGAEVGLATRTETWPVRLKRPALALTWSLYDGDSAGSTGNRDHQVNNGERIEIALLAANHGEIAARDVRIDVGFEDPLLLSHPGSIEIGSLPPRSQAPERRLIFEVPRGFGHGRTSADLHLVFTLTQADFPVARVPAALPFRYQSPDLVVEVSSPEGIARGVRDELSFEVANRGDLAAEGIAVEVSSETPGLDLMDERGIPGRTRRFDLSAVPAHVAAPRRRLEVQARQEAAIGPARLKIAVTQRDFPPVTRFVQLTVADAQPTVISAAKPAEAPVSMPAQRAVPPTISFRGFDTGQHVSAQAVDLQFEVQSTSPPDDVRLTQNGRRLPLEAAKHTLSALGDLKVSTYGLTVQLEPGENHFEVLAVTQGGQRSRLLSLVRDPPKGRWWVAAIGISAYADRGRITPLQFAAADARAVHDYFRDTFDLPSSQLFLLTNDDATLRNIRQLLGETLPRSATSPDDTVVIYFAGHGVVERRPSSSNADGLEKYLLPYDAALQHLPSTALRTDEIQRALLDLTAERAVVLLDSCFSGIASGRARFISNVEGIRAIPSGEFLDRIIQAGKGRVLLTASAASEAAIEDPDRKHGLFTYYLLEALRGAAGADPDGSIDVDTVYRYVSEKVQAATANAQHPDRKTSGGGRIVIGRSSALVHTVR